MNSNFCSEQKELDKMLNAKKIAYENTKKFTKKSSTNLENH